jgi:hypothetical protein
MIDDHRFADSSLEFIEIPMSVECIGDSAFFKCRRLRELSFEIESRRVSVGVKGLSNSNVANVTFPRNLISLGVFCFPQLLWSYSCLFF